jgi:hypothetical protein
MNKTDFRLGTIVEKDGKQGKVISIREDKILYNVNGIIESAAFNEVVVIKRTLRELKEEIYKKINKKTRKEEIITQPNGKALPAVAESIDSLFEANFNNVSDQLSEKKKVKEDSVGPEYNARLQGSSGNSGGLSGGTSIVTEIKEWLMREDVKQMFKNRYGSSLYEQKMMEAAKRMNEAAMERKSFNNVYDNLKKKKKLNEFPVDEVPSTGYAKQGDN